MALIEVKVPDIGDFKDVPVIEILVKPGEFEKLLAEQDPDRDMADKSDEDTAVILYTSGTTGTPKGAVFTDRQLDAITRMDVGDVWGGGPPMLASTQFAHVGFMTKLPWYLRLGGTMHLLHRWRAADVLDLVDDLHESGCAVVMVLHDLNLATRYSDNLIVMREGSILAQGHPRDVMTAELLEEAFGLRAKVIDDPVGNRPLIVPIGRTHVSLD